MKQNSEMDFLGVVVHDLKTPLSAVKGFVELIEQAGSLNERQRHFSERAIAGLLKMESMISELLDYTRLESGVPLKYTEVDLKVMIEEAVELQEDTARTNLIALQFTAVPDAGMLLGDARLLSRMVHNLLSNAIKYNRQQGVVRITLWQQEGSLYFDVEDTGEGIPPEDVPQVFKRYFRSTTIDRKKEGNGLGLAIVQAVVERHGGDIQIQSELGVGTRFRVRLPCVPPST